MSKLILEKLTENQLETLRILLDENRIANDIELLFEIRDDIIDEFANANADGNDSKKYKDQLVGLTRIIQLWRQVRRDMR
ncbi:MAG: hypothetical protein UFP31_07930 [Prevotella sp.]|jgi:hypothetical protein|uniref:Uncharacterized protein n=1 Tax=Siphoviridae sp. ctdYc1 TaxID=2826399 RepID=A0A8S5N0F2_9CAUD|nr:hypothetical protein [Prevotella sp.]DAD88081.1 MAG TPA: hypothetical protein [Siphoviridae sp. ctdYc1]